MAPKGTHRPLLLELPKALPALLLALALLLCSSRLLLLLLWLLLWLRRLVRLLRSRRRRLARPCTGERKAAGRGARVWRGIIVG
jgi:hypothetical protein